MYVTLPLKSCGMRLEGIEDWRTELQPKEFIPEYKNLMYLSLMFQCYLRPVMCCSFLFLTFRWGVFFFTVNKMSLIFSNTSFQIR
jgi:hypothetical protein